MKKFHLLHYVSECTPKLKKFKTIKDLDTFVRDFEKKHPPGDRTGDYWIDYAVTNVTGLIYFYDESMDLER